MLALLLIVNVLNIISIVRTHVSIVRIYVCHLAEKRSMRELVLGDTHLRQCFIIFYYGDIPILAKVSHSGYHL